MRSAAVPLALMVAVGSACAPSLECVEDSNCAFGYTCISGQCSEVAGTSPADPGGGQVGGPVTGGGGGGVNRGNCQGGLNTFNPAEVYLQGTSSEGSANNLLGPMDDPDTFGAGIHATPFYSGMLRPDGRFVYVDFGDTGAFLFNADPFEFSEDFDRCIPITREDALLVGCDVRAQNLKLLPDGSAVVRCQDQGWIVEGGEVLAEASLDVLHFGRSQMALTPTHIVDLSKTPVESTPLNPPLPGFVVAVRGEADGFRLVVKDGSDFLGVRVTFDGTVTELGGYVLPDARYQITNRIGESGLASNGDFYIMGGDNDVVFNDVIVKMKIDAPAEIVLDEVTVKAQAVEGEFINVMHISQLATGW